MERSVNPSLPAITPAQVQVTSCGTPVLWHDDLIVMTGQLGETIKVPVRDLSLVRLGWHDHGSAGARVFLSRKVFGAPLRKQRAAIHLPQRPQCGSTAAGAAAAPLQPPTTLPEPIAPLPSLPLSSTRAGPIHLPHV